MAEQTNIGWCDSTFNPWIGCSKVSPGCAHCYAEVSTPVRTARAQGRELWGKGAARQRTSAANWKQPLRWNFKAITEIEAHPDYAHVRPRVFCASLSDWLDDEVPIEWLADLLKLIHDTPNLDWLLLSKRPENFKVRVLHAGLEMMGYVDGQKADYPEALADAKDATIESVLGWSKGDSFPNNVWIGTTVEDQKRADERIPELLNIPAKVRFLSCEPLLEPIDLWAEQGIHWVIVGGESGPKKRPFNPDWARSIRTQCELFGQAFFMKQWDKVQPIPPDLMIREFPRSETP